MPPRARMETRAAREIERRPVGAGREVIVLAMADATTHHDGFIVSIWIDAVSRRAHPGRVILRLLLAEAEELVTGHGERRHAAISE
jgi:hypothetical protein